MCSSGVLLPEENLERRERETSKCLRNQINRPFLSESPIDNSRYNPIEFYPFYSIGGKKYQHPQQKPRWLHSGSMIHLYNH